jgi:hypothetical protein
MKVISKIRDMMESRAMGKALRRLPAPEVPPGLKDRLLADAMQQPIPEQASPAGEKVMAGQRGWRWAIAGGSLAAAAAVLVLAVQWQGLWRQQGVKSAPVGPAPAVSVVAEVTIEDIDKAIAREATAAKLSRVADMLDQYPAGKDQAIQSRRYIVANYSETLTAKLLAAKTTTKGLSQ